MRSHRLFIVGLGFLFVAGLSFRAWADGKDDAAAAAKKVVDAKNYTWKATTEGGFGAGGGGLAMLQPPGTYTVKLSVGGRDYTQQLRVLKDPHSGGTEADIAAQQQFLTNVRRDLDTTVDAINNAEVVRAQIHNFKNLTQDAELKKAADDLDEKLAAGEGQLVELRATGRGQDGVRWGSKLVGKLSYLAGGLAGADFKPTNQQGEVQKVLEDLLKKYQAETDALLNRDLNGLNEVLRGAKAPTIMLPKIGVRSSTDQ